MPPSRLLGFPLWLGYVRAVAFTLALTAATNVAATVVPDLYRASVPVVDRSETEFTRARAEALGQVVVKLTGSSGARRLDATRQLMGRAAGYVQQFGYERASDSSGFQSLYLGFDFDPDELTRAMRERGLPVWGKERPETLIWLVLDGPEGRTLLGAGGESSLPAVIRQRAAARGLPIVVPAVDAADNAAVAAASDDRAMAEALLARSARFGTELALIVHLVTTPIGLIDSTWLLVGRDGSESWTQAGDIAALLVEEGAEVMADRIGAQFATADFGAEAETVAITVDSVMRASDYARANVYLQSIDVVTDVFVRTVAANTVAYELSVRGGLAALRQSVSFGEVLAPLDDTGTAFRFGRNVSTESIEPDEAIGTTGTTGTTGTAPP